MNLLFKFDKLLSNENEFLVIIREEMFEENFFYLNPCFIFIYLVCIDYDSRSDMRFAERKVLLGSENREQVHGQWSVCSGADSDFAIVSCESLENRSVYNPSINWRCII